MYIIVRRNLTHPQQAVQASHAATVAAKRFISDQEIDNLHIAILGVADEVKLLKCASKLEAQGVRFCLFTEPDMGNEATAIATEAIFGERRRIFRNYQLLKSDTAQGTACGVMG